MKTLQYAAILSVICIAGTSKPMFETLSLEEFGIRDNLIPSVQKSALINPSAPLRTNHWHALQLANAHKAPTRFGPYLLSQSGRQGPEGNGLGVLFPTALNSEMIGGNCLSLCAASKGTLLTFSSNETMIFDVQTRIGEKQNQSKTYQSLDLKFKSPLSPQQYLMSHLVTGNAFLDVRYQELSPVIKLDDTSKLKSVVVFNKDHPNGQVVAPHEKSIVNLEGHKFRFTVEDQARKCSQTWLLYVEPPEGQSEVRDVKFACAFNHPTPFIFKSTRPFTGFLRLAVIANAPVATHTQQRGASCPATLSMNWLSNLCHQMAMPSANAIYMLWPQEFLEKASSTAVKSIQNGEKELKSRSLAMILNLVATRDFKLARNCFSVMFDRSKLHNDAFGLGMNPFTAYFSMLMGRYLTKGAESYQKLERAFPEYDTHISQRSIEDSYDRARHAIPVSCEIEYLDNQYLWKYKTTQESESAPLILFPSYKRLSNTSRIFFESGFALHDPIAGKLYAARADSSKITFQEGALPSYLLEGKLLPQNLWKQLTKQDITTLEYLLGYEISSFNTSKFKNSNPMDAAQEAYQLGQTLRLGTYVLEKIGRSYLEIQQSLSGHSEALKKLIDIWMLQRQKTARNRLGVGQKEKLPTDLTQVNFFIGDATNGSLQTCLHGMTNQDGSAKKESAGYSDHMSQYAYWLSAVNAIIEWDQNYGDDSPWISRMTTSPTGLTSKKMKYYVDLLWRDVINPDTDDPDFPYHRTQNPFFGHALDLGIGDEKAQEFGSGVTSIAENFGFWNSAYEYARLILASPDLDAADKKGFNDLLKYCKTNLSMTATGGTRFYQTSNWPFVDRAMRANPVVGKVYDAQVHTNTGLEVGGPNCSLSTENMTFSPFRLDQFNDESLAEVQEEEKDAVEVKDELDFFIN